MSQSNQPHRFVAHVADRDITLETGKLAGQAGGAVVIRAGDTVVLATATASKEPREGADFFPLSVDYEERLYAAGRIPGSFFRREGKPSAGAGIGACALVTVIKTHAPVPDPRPGLSLGG